MLTKPSRAREQSLQLILVGVGEVVSMKLETSFKPFSSFIAASFIRILRYSLRLILTGFREEELLGYSGSKVITGISFLIKTPYRGLDSVSSERA